MNTPTTLLPGEPGIHQTLLESAVPKWLTTAPAALREAYFSSSSSSLYSSTQARTLLAAVQTAEVFCTPLLQAALDREYPTLGLHATGHELIRKVRDSDALISRLMPRQQTLLEAALQNFLPDEAKAGGIEKGSVIAPVGAYTFAINDDGTLQYRLVDQSYWVLYLQKVFDMQFKALNAAWDDAMLLFDDATDPLEPFSLSGSRLTEAQAKLQALDPAMQWEGVPRKITLDSQGKVQTYKLIMKGREDAQQALVLKLSNEQVAAAPR